MALLINASAFIETRDNHDFCTKLTKNQVLHSNDSYLWNNNHLSSSLDSLSQGLFSV